MWQNPNFIDKLLWETNYWFLGYIKYNIKYCNLRSNDGKWQKNRLKATPRVTDYSIGFSFCKHFGNEVFFYFIDCLFVMNIKNKVFDYFFALILFFTFGLNLELRLWDKKWKFCSEYVVCNMQSECIFSEYRSLSPIKYSSVQRKNRLFKINF